MQAKFCLDLLALIHAFFSVFTVGVYSPQSAHVLTVQVSAVANVHADRVCAECVSVTSQTDLKTLLSLNVYKVEP